MFSLWKKGHIADSCRNKTKWENKLKIENKADREDSKDNDDERLLNGLQEKSLQQKALIDVKKIRWRCQQKLTLELQSGLCQEVFAVWSRNHQQENWDQQLDSWWSLLDKQLWMSKLVKAPNYLQCM